MYLHLGQDTVITTKSIIGIFDMDRCTVSKKTRDYLTEAEKKENVVNVSYELPKSFIVCKENGKIMVYISQLSSKTLYKRNKEGTYKILQSEIN
ncbi:extracellular matrix/biofilm biosynthesis regulator RemA family protein [Ruminococcus sp.]|uniref:extracellular matrix regulator RemB n=1 Tax=Ruminococcus TaxID=1263 RepID=UPI00307B2215